MESKWRRNVIDLGIPWDPVGGVMYQPYLAAKYTLAPTAALVCAHPVVPLPYQIYANFVNVGGDQGWINVSGWGAMPSLLHFPWGANVEPDH